MYVIFFSVNISFCQRDDHNPINYINCREFFVLNNPQGATAAQLNRASSMPRILLLWLLCTNDKGVPSTMIITIKLQRT